MVTSVDPTNILWSDIHIDGTCSTSGLGTYVTPGDFITNCYGTITLTYTPLSILIGIWEFSPASTPTIQFSKSDMHRTLTVVSINPSNILWSDIDVSGYCNTTFLGTYVEAGDLITKCYNTVTFTYIPTSELLGSFTFQGPPTITFAQDNSARTITVTSVSQNYVSWNDIKVDGQASVYYSSSGSGYMTAGDQIRYCSGIVTLTFAPTQTFLESFTFLSEIPEISFVQNDVAHTLTVTSVDRNNLPWSYMTFDGDCDTSGLGTYVEAGDVVTACYGTIELFYNPSGSSIGYWVFSQETLNIQFSYNSIKNTLTIISVDSGHYYSDSVYQQDANLVFERNNLYNNFYVLSDMAAGTYGSLSTKEIKAGDKITGFNIGFYTIRWKPTGKEIGTFTVTSSSENIPLFIVFMYSKSATEGSSFSIQVVYDEVGGDPAKNATVIFNGKEYYTNFQGYVTLVAPLVDKDTEYVISSIKNGYKSTTAYITILDVPEAEFGWVYGTVTLKNKDVSMPANGTLVTIGIPEKGGIIVEDESQITQQETYFVTKPVYTVTDEDGNYNQQNLLVGTYIVEVDYKSKHATRIMEVKANQGTEVDFVLNISETRILIEKSIIDGKVGAELIISEVNKVYDHEVFIYDGVQIDPVIIGSKEITILVSGDENGGGRTIAISTNLDMFDLTKELDIKYDGEQIKMADDITDVLNPNDDGAHSEYLLAIGDDGIEILISIPHFSEHQITIANTMQGSIPAGNTGSSGAIFTYALMCVIAAILFVGIIYVRRRY